MNFRHHRVNILTSVMILAAATLACQAASSVGQAVSPATAEQPPQAAANPTAVDKQTPTETPGLPVLEDSEATVRIIEAGDFTTLYDLKNEQAQDETYKPDVERYTVEMSPDNQIDLGPGWCARTSAIRDDNKKHFHPAVTVNDYLVPDRDLEYFEWTSDDGLYCFSWDIVASSWPTGQHQVSQAFAFDAPINDGWDDYPAGEYVTEYTITVSPDSGSSTGSASGGDDCISWDEVTAAMKGDTVCVRGVIVRYNPEYGNSRYYFSDKPSTFFLYSALFEFYDPDTGKTVAPGGCEEITAQVQVQSGIPFMNLDLLDQPGHEDESFRVSDACN